MDGLLVISASVPSLPVWSIVIGLLGGLALFMHGINMMASALQGAAGAGMKRLLARLTGNRFKGVLTGFAVTGIVQSSAFTTVVVIGFISAGMMTLRQAVGVIMGANIGTTVTVQLAAFKVVETAWLLVALGFLVRQWGRRDAARQLGIALMGLGLLFLALEQMSAATRPLSAYPPFLEAMKGLEHPLAGILIGAAFTGLVQSSSVTTGVLIALASEGLVSLPAALAMALGANIGSCVPAVLASLGKPAEAKQAAFVHLLFNVLGVVAWAWWIPELGRFSEAVSHGDLPRQVATAHALFNISNTAVMIWFCGPLAWLAGRVFPAPVATTDVAAPPLFLDPALLKTPSLAVERLGLQLGHIGQRVASSLEEGGRVVMAGTREDADTLSQRDEEIDRLHVATLEYARLLSREALSHPETRRLEQALAAATLLEHIADVITTNLAQKAVRRIEYGLHIGHATELMLTQLCQEAQQLLNQALQCMQAPTPEAIQGTRDLRQFVAHTRREAERHMRQRLLTDDPLRALTFQWENDVANLLERIADSALHLAELSTPASNTLAPPDIEASPSNEASS